jgi:hypothetical protein
MSTINPGGPPRLLPAAMSVTWVPCEPPPRSAAAGCSPDTRTGLRCAAPYPPVLVVGTANLPDRRVVAVTGGPSEFRLPASLPGPSRYTKAEPHGSSSPAPASPSPSSSLDNRPRQQKQATRCKRRDQPTLTRTPPSEIPRLVVGVVPHLVVRGLLIDVSEPRPGPAQWCRRGVVVPGRAWTGQHPGAGR